MEKSESKGLRTTALGDTGFFFNTPKCKNKTLVDRFLCCQIYFGCFMTK